MKKSPRQRIFVRFAPYRDRDFLEICRQIVRDSNIHLTRRQIVERAILHPAPSYYADLDYALHVVPRVLRLPREEAEKFSHGRWLEVGLRARALVATGECRNMTRAIETVITHGVASRFFMSVATGMHILSSY